MIIGRTSATESFIGIFSFALIMIKLKPRIVMIVPRLNAIIMTNPKAVNPKETELRKSIHAAGHGAMPRMIPSMNVCHLELLFFFERKLRECVCE